MNLGQHTMSNYKFRFINVILVTAVVTAIFSGCAMQGGRNAKTAAEENVYQTDPVSQSNDNKNKQNQLFEKKVHYIFFEKNETRFDDTYSNELMIVFDELQKNKDSCVEIYGYDSADKDLKNSKKLADLRAEWIKRCLKAEGVDTRFIKIVQGMEPVKLPKKATIGDIRQSRRGEVHVVPCFDAEFKLMNKASEIDHDNPFKYK